jgi:hypothetical protein
MVAIPRASLDTIKLRIDGEQPHVKGTWGTSVSIGIKFGRLAQAWRSDGIVRLRPSAQVFCEVEKMPSLLPSFERESLELDGSPAVHPCCRLITSFLGLCKKLLWGW